MEKLVRRHIRKEPGHLACRAGPIVFALLVSLVVPSTVLAQSMGNPAKVVRVNSLEHTSAETSAPATRTLVQIPTTSAEVRTETPDTKVTGEQKTVMVVSTGPYLPLTGALPLRFASSRKWPAPLPKSTTPSEETVSTVAQAPATIATPAETRPVMASAPNPSNSTTIGTGAVATMPTITPAKTEPQAAMLTADMVLGYLGNLPPGDARVSVRFEPAIPQGAVARSP